MKPSLSETSVAKTSLECSGNDGRDPGRSLECSGNDGRDPGRSDLVRIPESQ